MGVQFYLLLCSLAIVHCYQLPIYNDAADFQQLLNIIGRSRVPERFRGKDQQMVGQPRVDHFNFHNCGKNTDPIQVTSLQLGPDPLKIPGNITLAVKAATTQTLAAPIKVDVKMKKKVLFWVEVPCIDDIGSCTYDDVCSLLTQIKCPAEFKKYGIPCQCPIKAGSYSLPTTSIEIPKIPDVPSFLTDGDYQITATLSSGATELGCLYLELSLAKGSLF